MENISSHKCQVPWGAARLLIRRIFEQEGREIDWGSHKGIISLTVPELESQLTPEERAERHRYDGQRLAFLPGVALNLRPVQEAWADTLAAALAERALHLRIPDPSLWDLESIAVLRPLLGRLGPARFSLILGECGAEADWQIQKETKLLRAALSVSGSPARDDEALELSEPWPDQLDIREAMSAYGFCVVLSQARQMLEDGSENPAKLHAMAGLAIYHQDQFALSDSEIGEEFERHMQAWLVEEKDPLLRSTAHYYLAMYYGRARREFQRGLDYANQALEEAGDSPHHRAWGLNSKAYHFAKFKRVDEAYSCCNQAYELKQEPLDPKLSWTLAGNICQVFSSTGDHDRAQEWSQKQAEHERDVPSCQLPPVWSYPYRDRRNLASIVERCRGRLEMTSTRMDLYGFYLCSQIIGDATYRLGQADQAFQHFRQARFIGLELGEESEDLFEILERETRAALRAGQLEAAEWGLRELLVAYSYDENLRLELTVLLAQISAHRGEFMAAFHDTRKALEEANSKLGALLQIAPLVGEVYRACGDRELEQNILEAVRKLASNPGVPPEDAFRLLAALPELGLDEASLAVALAPAALELPECWWSLDTLVPLLKPHSQSLTGDLNFVTSAANQRVSKTEAQTVSG